MKVFVILVGALNVVTAHAHAASPRTLVDVRGFSCEYDSSGYPKAHLYIDPPVRVGAKEVSRLEGYGLKTCPRSEDFAGRSGVPVMIRVETNTFYQFDERGVCGELESTALHVYAPAPRNDSPLGLRFYSSLGSAQIRAGLPESSCHEPW